MIELLIDVVLPLYALFAVLFFIVEMKQRREIRGSLATAITCPLVLIGVIAATLVGWICRPLARSNKQL